MAVALNNIGRLVQQIPGITGVNAGGTALVNIPVNARYHRLLFYCTDNAAPSITKITGAKILVNGQNMRDITPAQIVNIAKTNGYTPAAGFIPIEFTEPWRNELNPGNDSNSWDLAGQSTFSVQFSIDATATNPTIIGVQEFDYLRNVQQQGNAQVPFLQPVAQHAFVINGASGLNAITQLPIDFPIARMHISSGGGNHITLVEVYQDGNKIVEGTPAELNEMAAAYGMLYGAGNPFETGAVFDIDGRWWKALKVANNLNIRVTLSQADTITIIMETLPGAFQS